MRFLNIIFGGLALVNPSDGAYNAREKRAPPPASRRSRQAAVQALSQAAGIPKDTELKIIAPKDSVKRSVSDLPVRKSRDAKAQRIAWGDPYIQSYIGQTVLAHAPYTQRKSNTNVAALFWVRKKGLGELVAFPTSCLQIAVHFKNN